MDPVTTTAAVNTAAHSLSPSPFPACQPGGQAVMILLASVWYWAVIINKVILLRKLKTGI